MMGQLSLGISALLQGALRLEEWEVRAIIPFADDIVGRSYGFAQRTNIVRYNARKKG